MPKAAKGSQKWIQILVNEHPNIFDEYIGEGLNIEWVSPLAVDDYHEYRDNPFLEKLGISLDNFGLKEFWPSRGPKWDALGKDDSGGVYLVEAKSHIDEIDVYGTGARDKSSIGLISQSLDEVRDYLDARHGVDWSNHFYQYCNRLAHLYLLRVRNWIDANLVWVYFLNDQEMKGPSYAEEWYAAIKLMKNFLGIQKTELDPYIIECFIDVNELS